MHGCNTFIQQIMQQFVCPEKSSPRKVDLFSIVFFAAWKHAVQGVKMITAAQRAGIFTRT